MGPVLLLCLFAEHRGFQEHTYCGVAETPVQVHWAVWTVWQLLGRWGRVACGVPVRVIRGSPSPEDGLGQPAGSTQLEREMGAAL